MAIPLRLTFSRYLCYNTPALPGGGGGKGGTDMHDLHHDHPHSHAPRPASSPEETLALLKYMLGHNRHHAEELHDLAHGVDDQAVQALLHEAVELLQSSNEKLDAALTLWKGE